SCFSLRPVISRPSNRTEPSEASISPISVRPSVDLPEPDSPTTPSTSPRRRSRLTPPTALTEATSHPRPRSRNDPRSKKYAFHYRTSISASPISGLLRRGDLLALERHGPALRHLAGGPVEPARDPLRPARPDLDRV